MNKKKLEHRRLRAARFFAKGITQAETARRLNVSREAARLWSRAWKRKGVAGLEARTTEGRPSRLTKKQERKIKKILSFRKNAWSQEEIAALIKQIAGVTYHPSHAGRIARQLAPRAKRRGRESDLQRNERVLYFLTCQREWRDKVIALRTHADRIARRCHAPFLEWNPRTWQVVAERKGYDGLSQEADKAINDTEAFLRHLPLSERKAFISRVEILLLRYNLGREWLIPFLILVIDGLQFAPPQGRTWPEWKMGKWLELLARFEFEARESALKPKWLKNIIERKDKKIDVDDQAITEINENNRLGDDAALKKRMMRLRRYYAKKMFDYAMRALGILSGEHEGREGLYESDFEEDAARVV